jgi:hypothetical protein
MSTTAHVFVAVVTMGTLTFIIRLVRRRQMRAKYSVFWVSVGGLMAVLAVSPGLLDTVSDLLGIAYAPTTIFILAIVLLVLVAVHFSWELSRLEQRTRILAQDLALMMVERNPPDSRESEPS